MFVLDTNTVIYFFKGLGRVAENLLAVSPSDIALPTVVLYEIEVGIAKSERPRKRREQVDRLVRSVNLLPFGFEEAGVAARLRASLELAGTPIGPYDTLIAATALASSATLVTRNVREFQRVRGLEVVDWFESSDTSRWSP